MKKFIYLIKKLQPLYNIIAVSFKTKIFASVLSLVLEAYEKNPNDLKLIEGLARINGFLEIEQNLFISLKNYIKLIHQNMGEWLSSRL